MSKRKNKVRGKTVSRELREDAVAFFDDKYPHSKTRNAYIGNYCKFITYCREAHNCKSKEDCFLYIQEYANLLAGKGYTPSTVHSYLAPVCLYHGISLGDVDKPKRCTAGYKRGRKDNGRAERADNDMLNQRYEHTVSFQKMVGIRRNELKKLTGEDLVRDESNYLCVRVKRGKGGKMQLQRILPEDEEAVKTYFKGKGEKEHIFNEIEFENSIAYHSLRAKQARKAYDYYLDKIQENPLYRNQLEEEIRKRWELYCIDDKTGLPKRFKKSEVAGTYKLRGDNKKLAAEKGLPTEYDRLATMAVSVFHLSHWRLDVTVSSYLLAV